MNRRRNKPTLTARLIGHSFGVFGAMMGINSIVTSINPRFLRLFPFESSGIQQTSAGLISIGLIALGMWMIWEKDAAPRAKAKAEPPESL